MELWVGYTAAFCTTISFIPQVITVLKEDDLTSLSLGMYSIFAFGVTLWLVYGILRGDIIIISANAITLFLALIILVAKIRHKNLSRKKIQNKNPNISS
jgi:MtN3 and saliva related transmembrane protein